MHVVLPIVSLCLLSVFMIFPYQSRDSLLKKPSRCLEYLLAGLFASSGAVLILFVSGRSLFWMYLMLLYVLFFSMRTDMTNEIIEDRLLLSAIAVSLVLQLLSPAALLWEALIGGIALSGIMLLISFITRGGIGYGDIKLIGLCGFMLGWKAGGLGLLAALLFSSILSIFLLVFRMKKRADHMPFTPMLTAGMFASMLLQ